MLQIDNMITIKGYIYIKFKIRTSFNGQDLLVYQNIGTCYILVVQLFFFYFSDVKINKITILTKIAGYLGTVIKFQE